MSCRRLLIRCGEHGKEPSAANVWSSTMSSTIIAAMAQLLKPVGPLLVFAVVCVAAPADAQTPPVRVGMRVVNAVAADTGTLGHATTLASRLFADHGIGFVWKPRRPSVCRSRDGSRP